MIQMIFQDPFGSLNPRRRVGDIITRAAVLAGCSAAPRRRRGRRNFSNSSVSSAAPITAGRRAFSGGQRQRIGIARAPSPCGPMC